jgi:diacylglycerol kinase family enzyme
MSKARLLRHLPTLYRGGILDVPGVVYRRGRRLEADPLDGHRVFVEADGESVGRLPAEVRVEEGALRVAVAGA